MKTRQQRLNEARAGRPPSPPQSLSYNQRGPKRTRAKPSATVAAGSFVPAAQSAVQGEAQSLLYVWVDFGPDASSRPVNDPTHKLIIPSSSIPALIAFAETLRNQDKKSPRPAEEEHFPAVGPTGPDEGESKQAEVEEQIAERIIRSASQTPDPTSKIKRKRWGDEVDTPSPEIGSYGRGGRDLYGHGSPEEEEEAEERPGKIRRTREQEGFTSRVAGESNTARQNVGLKAQHTTIQYQGGNVLTEYYEAARNMANNGKQSLAKAPIPIADTTGKLKAPSPGREKKSDEEVVTAGLRAVTPSHQKNRELGSGSPAHRQSNLPEEEEILRPSEVAALRKLRDRVENYKAALPGRRPSRA